MFLHCISAALKKKKKRFLWDTKEQQTEQKHSRGCWRHEGYCSHFVTFLIFLSQLNYVQVFSILHRAAVTELKMTRRGLKCHKEKKKKKQENWRKKEKKKKTQNKTRKAQARGERKPLSTALRTDGGKFMHPIIFYLPGKRSRRWKVLQRTTNLFLVELIQTVVSTVETRQTEPTGRSTSARSLRPHLVIYILFF